MVRHGLLAMVCPSTSETVNEQDYLDHFLNADAAGVVVINGRYSQINLDFTPYEILRDKGLPVVLVNGMGKECPVPAVSVDLTAAGAAAIRHLADLGHRRIGCLVGPRRYWSADLLINGWQVGLRERGIPADESLISETLFTIEGGRAGVAKLLEAGATAVVTGGDLMALGAIAGVRAWGKEVPADVSVVGFDGTPITAHTQSPAHHLPSAGGADGRDGRRASDGSDVRTEWSRPPHVHPGIGDRGKHRARTRCNGS